MAEELEYRKLSREELNALAGEELPEKAAMALLDANVSAPINAALASNVAGDDSVSHVRGTQDVDIERSAG